MLNFIMRWILLAMAAVLARGADDYAMQIEQFRAAREAELKADDGWLTVVGLHWLKEGANRVGSGLGSDVPLPAAAPAKVGVIMLSHGSARFTPEAGAHVTLNGKHANAAALAPNTDIIATGRIKFFLIQRPDGLAVRVKDNDSTTRREFTHLNWFLVDPAWRFEARYTAFEQPETLLLDTQAGGRQQHSSPGYVTFRKDGRDYRLDPVLEGERLFFAIRPAGSRPMAALASCTPTCARTAS